MIFLKYFKLQNIIIFILLLTLMIGAVNASEINSTDVIADVSDDAPVQGVSDEPDIISSDDVSEDALNQEISDTQDAVSLDDASQDSIIRDSEEKSDNVYNFSDLQNKIHDVDEDANLTLSGTYKYDDEADYELTDGVLISKNLRIIGQNCTIDGSAFARCLNIASTLQNAIKVTLENIAIINGYCENPDESLPLKKYSGAGISVGEGVTLILKNCIFKNNKVYNGNGAALITNENCNVEIEKCTFENNTSIRDSDQPWDDFKAGMASAIYSKWGSTLSITDSTFKSNNAYLTTVLLVSYHNSTAYDTSKLYVKDCRFEDNTVEKRGVIYLDELGEGEILDSTFINNHSPESTGTVVLDSSKSAVVKNCLFEGNDGVNGAGIYLDIFEGNSANVQIADCRFINNFASSNGGAVYSKNGILNINNCIFENNRCNKNGGAIYSTGGSLTVSASTFNANRANNGGAIYSTTANAHIANSNFINNNANNKGASVYLTGFAYLENCVYLGNYAPNDNVNIYGISNNFKVNGYIVSLDTVKTTYNVVGKTMKITLRNSETGQYIVGVKLKINVYTGSTYKTYYAVTNEKGFVVFNVPKLSAGTHKVIISSAEGCVLNSAKTMSIVVSKAKATVTAPKVTKRYKSKSYFKITVKYKTTKKAIPKIKVKIKIKTGKKVKTVYKKTNNKGIIKLSTKSLKRGKHKVTITSANSNISFSKKSTIVIR
jgi:predicted outer membrane repeat protein